MFTKSNFKSLLKGINYGSYVYKISQYADDATNFVSDMPSIQEVINTIDRFSRNAGLKLNLQKTRGI